MVFDYFALFNANDGRQAQISPSSPFRYDSFNIGKVL
jgi:hypothetical protein